MAVDVKISSSSHDVEYSFSPDFFTLISQAGNYQILRVGKSSIILEDFVYNFLTTETQVLGELQHKEKMLGT